jgi:hypothetical protein
VQPRPEGIACFNLAVLALHRSNRTEAIEYCNSAVDSLARLHQSRPAESLREYLVHPDARVRANAVRKCEQATRDCPDFYGFEFFKSWASDLERKLGVIEPVPRLSRE